MNTMKGEYNNPAKSMFIEMKLKLHLYQTNLIINIQYPKISSKCASQKEKRQQNLHSL